MEFVLVPVEAAAEDVPETASTLLASLPSRRSCFPLASAPLIRERRKSDRKSRPRRRKDDMNVRIQGGVRVTVNIEGSWRQILWGV